MSEQTSSRPSAVVFDLGKVLVDFDYGIAARRIAAQSNIPAEAVRHVIDQSALLLRYETGAMTRGEFFDAVRSATGFSGTPEAFASFFADVFSPIGEMIELQANLRAAGIPTFIFSNTNDLAIEHIRRNFPFFAQFDGYILSYEHGVMKPEVALYRVVEKMAGRSGTEILYLDDRLENVEAGIALGWQVIHHRDPEESFGRIKALGLLP